MSVKVSTVKLVVAIFAVATTVVNSDPKPLSPSVSPVQPERPPKMDILARYLNLVGKKLNCYFTVESNAGRDGSALPITNRVVLEEDVATIPALLAKLTRDLPTSEFIQDADDPKIIHIVSKSLAQNPDYNLIQKVSVLDFSGVLGGLPDVIGIKLHREVGSRHVFIFGDEFGDLTTRVQFTAHNKTARDVLTDYVPLSNYYHVLWSANTSTVNGKERSIVEYSGKPR